MLNSILTSSTTTVGLVICLAVSLVLGVLNSLVFSYQKKISGSFALTLALLPVAMCMVVMMINGNLGVAVAVAGSFTLVRFRSIAGTGREICAIFVDMTLGLILGMGYVGIAALFFVVVAIAVIGLTKIHFGENKSDKYLRITIPENYDYNTIFSDVFKKFNLQASIVKVKTINLGSLIDVTYRITGKGEAIPKEMLDALRSKNANLGIMVSNCDDERESL